MKIAYIVFNDITLLDFIGIYDPISRLKSMNYLPDLSWEICAFSADVIDNFGLKITPDCVGNDLSFYDVIVVPGGYGTRELQFNKEFIAWIQAAKNVKLKVSICTGSLILGAAGFLKGKKATTHFQEYESLKPYCEQVMEDRIVDQDTVITAGVVSSSIDLGLYLCEKWVGKAAASEIRRKMDYKG
jgi:transcriptional regulator GlxA family with amidase domain